MRRWLLFIMGVSVGLTACSSPAEIDLLAEGDLVASDGILAEVTDGQEVSETMSGELLDVGDAAILNLPDTITDADSIELTCNADSDCVAGYRCDLAIGFCVECLDYLHCDDDNGCTFDFCSGDGRCVNKPLEGDCDDSNPCTLGDHCVDGNCLFESILDCDDSNPCTKDLCQGDNCYHGNLEGPCDDGDPCTLADYCKIGSCVGGAVKLKCDDKNPCTVDSCVTSEGCLFQPGVGPCDDEDPCTTADQCTGTECAGVPLDCGDGNGCTTDSCQSGDCVNEALPESLCDDNNLCTADSCDPSTGDCVHSHLPGNCDDGSLCTSEDVCQSGVCTGSPNDCDDDNDCTGDECDPATGECANQPLEGLCDDGNLCTVGDECVEGLCQPGGGYPDCDDGNSCTGATCDPKVGCINDVLLGWPCDDGNGCTANDTCLFPADCLGEEVICQDDDPCTADTCDQATGECPFVVESGASCDDGDICTKKDLCQDDGSCAGVPKACDDLNPCTDDSCEPGSGCVNTPVVGPC
jgi:hypothetical protein